MHTHTHTHNLIKQFFTYKHIIISCVCVCARRVQILSGFCGAASARSEAETVSMATDPSSIPPPVESEMKGFMWWKEKGKKKKRERDREERRETLGGEEKESREDGNLFEETRRDDTSGIYSRWQDGRTGRARERWWVRGRERLRKRTSSWCKKKK